MRTLVAGLALAAVLPASTVCAQPAGPGLHDCIRTTLRYVIDAAADGTPMRLSPPGERFYPDRARRMFKTARVDLQCAAVSDRPTHCAVVRDTAPGFGFGDAAIQAAEASRLSRPAGVWPINVVVLFRGADPHAETVSYC